jgi:hypothetical protein
MILAIVSALKCKVNGKQVAQFVDVPFSNKIKT